MSQPARSDRPVTKAAARELARELADGEAARELEAHRDGTAADLFGEPVDPARAGRPAGAVNKRTEDTARYLRETFGDPLLADAKLAMTPVDVVAARLSCSALDAMDVVAKARARVLPYLHQRQPQAVTIEGEIGFPAQIFIAAPVAAAIAFDMAQVTTIDEAGEPVSKSEENQ